MTQVKFTKKTINKSFCIHKLLQIIDIFHPERKKERKDNKKKRHV